MDIDVVIMKYKILCAKSTIINDVHCFVKVGPGILSLLWSQVKVQHYNGLLVLLFMILLVIYLRTKPNENIDDSDDIGNTPLK